MWVGPMRTVPKAGFPGCRHFGMKRTTEMTQFKAQNEDNGYRELRSREVMGHAQDYLAFWRNIRLVTQIPSFPTLSSYHSISEPQKLNIPIPNSTFKKYIL